LKYMFRNSSFRRKVFLGGTASATGVILAVVIVLIVLALIAHADLANRMAEVAAVFAGATLLLAAVAAIVALLAYAVSTGTPDLKASVHFSNHPHPNCPDFKVLDEQDNEERIYTVTEAPLRITVRIHNNSGYSARNPAVIVRMQAMKFIESKTVTSPWVPIEFEHEFITAIQWDGGPTYSIHGHSTRRLPELTLAELGIFAKEGNAAFIVEMLAEGYRKKVPIPVRWYSQLEPSPAESSEPPNPQWM
jgi:hypothetical protein